MQTDPEAEGDSQLSGQLFKAAVPASSRLSLWVAEAENSLVEASLDCAWGPKFECAEWLFSC